MSAARQLGPVIRCGCCGAGYDLAAWYDLPLVGYMDIPAIVDYPAERLELRNCPCGSTISRSIGAGASNGQ